MIKLRRSVPDQAIPPVPRTALDTLSILVAVLIVGLGAFLLAVGMLAYRLPDTGERPVCPTPVPCATRGPGGPEK